MSKQAFEKKIEAIEALRSSADGADVDGQLRKALLDRNNYLVSKAATVAADLKREDLIPELTTAFDRFLQDAAKTDPQCWAKTAIAKALKTLEHRDGAVFLRGIRHIQFEPVWGGQSDSAGPLREACALALVDCRLDDLEILTPLTDLLADKLTPVRLGAALAIAQFGRPEGILPLRLKAWTGDADPEVLAQCFAALLALDVHASIPFLGGFLDSNSDDHRAEAAAALAQSPEPQAFLVVTEFYRRPRLPAEVRAGILIAMGASPRREAAEFLLSVLRSESGELGVNALQALASSRFKNEMRDAVGAIVTAHDETPLNRAFAREFA